MSFLDQSQGELKQNQELTRKNSKRSKQTLTWKTFRPFIHATNLDSVVLPAPLTPINNKCPCGGKSSKDDYETLHIRCWVRSRVTHMREIQHSPTHLRARKVSTADAGQIHGEER